MSRRISSQWEILAATGESSQTWDLTLCQHTSWQRPSVRRQLELKHTKRLIMTSIASQEILMWRLKSMLVTSKFLPWRNSSQTAPLFYHILPEDSRIIYISLLTMSEHITLIPGTLHHKWLCLEFTFNSSLEGSSSVTTVTSTCPSSITM